MVFRAKGAVFVKGTYKMLYFLYLDVKTFSLGIYLNDVKSEPSFGTVVSLIVACRLNDLSLLFGGDGGGGPRFLIT